MPICTYSATHRGAEGTVVEVEASLQKSLPSIVVTGLPGDVVKESRERIRACLSALGFDVPSSRLVIHLSPATEKKQGSQLDLAIAVALLCVEQLVVPVVPIEQQAFLGEVSLNGRIRGVQGALALAQSLCQRKGTQTVFFPEENAAEVALLQDPKCRPVHHVSQVLAALEGREPLPAPLSKPELPSPKKLPPLLDQIQGQAFAKRALEIALAGGHHLLLVGPPGIGKSLLAQAAPSLLPPLSQPELIQLLKNRGTAEVDFSVCASRPFRSPHHSISGAGLLGGGTGMISGGEIALAHGGVLFLDELPEYRKDVLEGLREPLQSGEIQLSRVGARLTFPARFQLIAAMNPCPCGYHLDTQRRCRCAPHKADAYRSRISGPILDRMDICAFLGSSIGKNETPYDSHLKVATRIQVAREIQHSRYQDLEMLNARARVEDHAGFELGTEQRSWLNHLCSRDYLSFRSLHKTIRVGRTIADLHGAEFIKTEHLHEAWDLRCRSLSNWS